MREQERKQFLKVGIFTSCMLGILLVFILTISAENKWFEPFTKIYAIVPSADNLKTGGIVQFRGMKIGKVTDIQIIDMKNVKIELNVAVKYLEWVKKNSQVEISTKGLVGDKMIVIKGGGKDDPSFEPNKDILYAAETTSMSDIMKKGSNIAERVDEVLIKLNVFLDQTTKDANLQKTLANVNESSKSLTKLLADLQKEQFGKNMAQSTKNLNLIMARINQGPGTMHSLFYDNSLYEQIDKLIGGAGRNRLLKYFIQQSLDSSKEEGEEQALKTSKE